MQKKKSPLKVEQVRSVTKKSPQPINKPVGKKPLNLTVHSQRKSPKSKSR